MLRAETRELIYGSISMMLAALTLFAVVFSFRQIFLVSSPEEAAVLILIGMLAFVISALVDSKLLKINRAILFACYRFLLLLSFGVWGIPLGVFNALGFGFGVILAVFISVLASWWVVVSFKRAAKKYRW